MTNFSWLSKISGLRTRTRQAANLLLLIAMACSAATLRAQIFSVSSYQLSSNATGSSNFAIAGNSLWFIATSFGDCEGYCNQYFIEQVQPNGTSTPYSLANFGVAGNSIVTGSDGALWFTIGSGSSAAIGRITTAGVITSFPIPGGAFTLGPGGIAAGSDGALWFTDSGAATIGRVTTAGVFSSFPLRKPAFGITTGPDGNIWVTEYSVTAPIGSEGSYVWSGSVASVTPAGVVSEYALPDQNLNFYSNTESPLDTFTTGPDGALWFTEYNGSRVGRVTTAGAVTTVYTGDAYGITTGPDGNLWFTQPYNDGANQPPALVRLTTAGVTSVQPVNTSTGTNFFFLSGIATGPDGALWFNDTSSSVIGRAVLTLSATTPCPGPTGVQGIPYTYTITSSGGAPPLTYNVPDSVLVPGLTVNPATGVMSGTPTASGTFAVSGFVTDSSTPTAQSASFSCQNAITILPPLAVTTNTLPGGMVGAAYNAPLNATGGTAPYSWAVSPNTPAPAGLGVAATGAVSGTPTATGSFTFTVTVTDSSSTPATASQQLSITIGAGAPAGIAATSGSGQSAQISTPFASPLVATVLDVSGAPVPGVNVTFTAPGSGASGTFVGAGTAATVQTNTAGVATSPGFIANATVGSYTVTAATAGIAPASYSLTNTTGAASTVTATSGGGQSAQISSAFGSPLAVTVTDSGGNPVSGVTVTFSAPGSGASATFAGSGATAAVQTNGSGVATSPSLTANTAVGSYTVTATAAGSSASASFALTNTPGGAASITATGGGGQSTAINTAFGSALSVVVRDSGGNAVANVTVTFNAPGGGASGNFSGAGTTATAQTNGSGVATSPGFTANATAGTYTVSASVGGVSGAAAFPLTNTAGAPASIAATAGNGQSTQIGNTFGSALSAVVNDTGGNPVPNVTVTFAVGGAGAGATFPGGAATATAQTNAQGQATSPAVTANSVAGSYTASASVAGVAGSASFALTNKAGGASSITVGAGNGQVAQINTAFASPLSVTVKDSGGNPVPNVTVAFTAPPSGATGTFAGGGTSVTTQTNNAGQAASPTFTANNTVGAYVVNASVSGVSTQAGFTLTNSVGAPSSITVTSGSGQSAQVNTNFTTPLMATVKDAGGNPVPNVAVSFSVIGSGAAGTFAGGGNTATATTNAAGVATSPVVTANGTAGSFVVNATTNGVSGPAGFSLTNTAGAPGSITITSGNGQSAQINTAFGAPLVVTVKDSSGNPVANASVVFTAPASGATGAFSGTGNSVTAQTNASGIATSTTFTANSTAGTYTISASVPGAATPVSFTMTNNSGSPSSITATSGGGQSAKVNSAFNNKFVATVKDANGNPVGGVTVTFTAPASGASGTFPGGAIAATAQTDNSGVATSPSLTANATAGAYSVNATVNGVTGSATFALVNQTGIAITTTTLPDGTAGLAYSFVLTVVNGNAPYTWSLSSGTLPDGLKLNPTTGEISGIPTATGTFPIVLAVTDSSTPPLSAVSLTLSLFINPPVTQPILPNFSITGIPTTPATPGTKITNGTITLDQVSSAEYAGTLTLTFTPNASVAVLPEGYTGDAGFVNTDGTKVTTTTVTIPAGTQSVALPTIDSGTVAGAVTVGLTVGAQNVASSTITVDPVAPIIEANSVQITNVTATGFDVELVATSTTRELTNATLTFTAAPGAQISGASSFTVNISALLAQWFASTDGLTYGGAFTLTLPFSLSGTASAIQGVSVTLANSVGTSTAVSGTR